MTPQKPNEGGATWYTSNEAAAMLRTAQRNIQNYCNRHKLPKFGRGYIITERDLEGMQAELGRVGRKPKGKEMMSDVEKDISHSG
jgi:hypothetical protein